MPSPPRLIVTSETADEFLWAEVLNLRGYDVIAQPFWESEVVRTLSLALRRREETAVCSQNPTRHSFQQHCGLGERSGAPVGSIWVHVKTSPCCHSSLP